MGWFRKKKVPYVPQGRIGYYRKNDYPWYFTVIVEEIGRIGTRSKIKIIDLSIDRDCDKSKKSCLKKFGIGDYIITNNINWETDEQRAIRFGGHESFLVDREVTEVREPDLRPLEQRHPPNVFNIDD